MRTRFLLLVILLTFGCYEMVQASELSVSGDTLCISHPEQSGDTLLCTFHPDSLDDSLVVQLEKNSFRYVKIGNQIYRNPLYTLFRVQDKNRTIALVLAILTGPLGGHRLYLGTKPIVPVVYTLTLGGGFFILPFIDIVMLLFSKDISRFENNDHIFMWLRD